MNQRHGLYAATLWLAPLFSGCLLRWESSPENDDEYYSDGYGSDFTVGRDDRVPGPHASRPTDVVEQQPLTPESGPAPEANAFPFDRYRELIVLDPEIVGGALADNADTSAPFSFRAQMQWLAGTGRDPLELTQAWLSRWENASEVGPELAPVVPRTRLRTVLGEPWLGESGVSLAQYVTPEPEPEGSYDPEPEGSYDPAASGGSEAGDEPTADWSRAPFRLIAIVNRVDLAADACSGSAGELRYIYAALDPRSGDALDLTLILEVPYPSTRTAAEWARAWKELGALSGQDYADGLAALTLEIQTDADPLRVRLRSNEVALSEPGAPLWELREFQLQVEQEALELVQVPLALTPRADADPAELSAYVLEHAEEIERAGAVLPESLRAGSAVVETADFSWNVLGVSERLRRAFSVQTCNGCHGGDTASLPFRHIGPGASLEDPAELSRFLYDPGAPTDELRRRAAAFDTLSLTECAPEEPVDVYGDEPRG